MAVYGTREMIEVLSRLVDTIGRAPVDVSSAQPRDEEVHAFELPIEHARDLLLEGGVELRDRADGGHEIASVVSRPLAKRHVGLDLPATERPAGERPGGG